MKVKHIRIELSDDDDTFNQQQLKDFTLTSYTRYNVKGRARSQSPINNGVPIVYVIGYKLNINAIKFNSFINNTYVRQTTCQFNLRCLHACVVLKFTLTSKK